MLNVVLITAMILAATLQSLFSKFYAIHYPGDPESATPVFSVISGLIVSVSGIVLQGLTLRISLPTLLLGLANAAVLLLFNASTVTAARTGPYSVQMTFMLSGGILLPAVIASVLGDMLSVGKWISMGFIILSIALVSRKKEEKEEEIAKKSNFYLACAGLFLTNGAYGALFDVQQRLTGPEEKESMVVVTYAVMAIVSFVLLLCRRKKAAFSAFRQNKKSLVPLLFCSLSIATSIYLMVFALQWINTAVLYTFDNAGVLLFSVIGARMFFKEKMSICNWIGCLISGAGLICMSVL